MELSSSNIKKFLYFFKVLFCISKTEPCTSQPNPKKTLKNKNSAPKKSLIFQEMELSNSNIKIILVFSEMKLCTSQPKPKKTKKNPHQKNFLYFPKWNFLALALKEFLYSLKRKLFLYFFKRKVLLYFRKRNPSLYTKNSEN